MNGVDNMLYIGVAIDRRRHVADQCRLQARHRMSIHAQVLVQNRVSIAVPRLPEEVQRHRRDGAKKSPDLMMVVHLISPDGTLRPAIHLQLCDASTSRTSLTRVDGVGDTIVFGARDYSMRVWLDPGKVQSRGLTAERRGRRVARGQRAGRGRRDQSAAGDVTGRLPAGGADTWAV